MPTNDEIRTRMAELNANLKKNDPEYTFEQVKNILRAEEDTIGVNGLLGQEDSPDDLDSLTPAQQAEAKQDRIRDEDEGDKGRANRFGTWQERTLQSASEYMQEEFGYIDEEVLKGLTTILEMNKYFGKYSDKDMEMGSAAKKLYHDLTGEVIELTEEDRPQQFPLRGLLDQAKDNHYRPLFDTGYEAAKAIFEPLNNSDAPFWRLEEYRKIIGVYDANHESNYDKFINSNYIALAHLNNKTPTIAEYVKTLHYTWALRAMVSVNASDLDVREKIEESKFYINTLKQREIASEKVKDEIQPYIAKIDAALNGLTADSIEYRNLAKKKSYLVKLQTKLRKGYFEIGGGYDKAVDNNESPMQAISNWVQQEGARNIRNSESGEDARVQDLGSFTSASISDAKAPQRSKELSEFIAKSQASIFEAAKGRPLLLERLLNPSDPDKSINFEEVFRTAGYNPVLATSQISMLIDIASINIDMEIAAAKAATAAAKGATDTEQGHLKVQLLTPDQRAELGPYDPLDPNLQLKIDNAKARDKTSKDQKTAALSGAEANRVSQQANLDFRQLPEYVREGLIAKYGPDVIDGIFKASGMDSAQVLALLNKEAALIMDPVIESTEMRGLFSKEAGFDTTKFSPNTQAKIEAGIALDQAEIADITHNWKFWNPFQSSLEPVAIGDTTGTGMPYQEAAGAKKIAELWKKSGHNIAVYFRLLNEDAGIRRIGTAGDLSPIKDIADVQREDLPGGLTPEERANFGFAGVEKGASAKSRKRAAEAYAARTIHPSGSLGRREAEAKFRAEDEEEKRKLEPKPPRGRVL